MGPGGAGHFVKMVHNGIEYGDMQLIAEAYHLMRDVLQLSGEAMQAIFETWNRGDLQSYLIEITAAILAFREADGELLLERILDAAGQKGTGRWTVGAALDLGVPLTLIGESVFARYLSALKDERVAAAGILGPPADRPLVADHRGFIADLEQALLAAKIISYAQGFALLRTASATYGWALDYSDIAMVWRNGCIIRSGFLEPIADAFRAAPDLSNLMLSPFFKAKLHNAQAGWRRVAARAVQHGIPIPALAGALTYYDGLRCASLPANLLQAQREYFGAHTYERVDQPRGTFFHTEWIAAPEK
jgi:6-phosphogluconate dehydrogenase